MLKFSHNYPLSQVTTLKIGGPAKLFVAVETSQDLVEAIQHAKVKGINYLVIGGGSNLLVNDSGIDCLVIKNEIAGISTSKESLSTSLGTSNPTFEVKVNSGTPLQDLVDYSIAHGLSGLQKLTGIQGTVGGAVYGNAGAYGQTISDHLTQVVILNPFQNLQTLSKEECDFSYRDSGFKRNGYTILEVTFQLETGDPKTLQKEADEVLKKRLIKYPKGIKCPGSFFKNIVAETLSKEVLDKIPKEAIVYGKLPAGFLLESVGAKGQALDGIYIADYHANLFINKGSGTAKAFYDLAKKYANLVKEKFGIILVPEVQLINLPTRQPTHKSPKALLRKDGLL